MVTALLDPTLDPDRALVAPPALPKAAARRLQSKTLRAEAAEWLARAAAHDLRIVTPDDPDYPDRLRDAPLRPNALFLRGDPGCLNTPDATMAIVGSRTLTAYGDGATRDFGGAIVRAGVAIASGLAYGVDALAHRAALDHEAPTFATGCWALPLRAVTRSCRCHCRKRKSGNLARAAPASRKKPWPDENAPVDRAFPGRSCSSGYSSWMFHGVLAADAVGS